MGNCDISIGLKKSREGQKLIHTGHILTHITGDQIPTYVVN